ncbi:DegT/DnrJ/EryC1/StrS family aminotransferase [Arthrobacter sp. B10-11]|uniref:DegT/DnrJ/EryC1/StrS family aminotransferase n=1 Tax=Arthrobacter sp. B10-11 TaxID=3081160 RepID=UPI0029534B12|nr:DegT/DnrJ/EryC1/StrS family aminotransferase [Arthrobacter sp. B10-11]MDV8149807.1 DegT/DnrJ/EryC1/StrS family aminotransferase [Arthrobacter sp. B10-11]
MEGHIQCRFDEREDPVTISEDRAVSHIGVMRPWLGQEEADAVVQVLASGRMAQGPRVGQFEEAFGAAQQAPHAVAVSSGAAALHLALRVAGIQPQDDVVMPSFCPTTTADAVSSLGARPVFADVEADTGNVSRGTIEESLTPGTRAVIVVDQGGVPVDLDPIKELCDPLGVTVIEDAACGVGSTYRGRPVGAGADLAVWSFDSCEVLTTGDGGMLTTRNEAWASLARHFREETGSGSGAEHGMTDLQAAIGLVQLGRLQEAVAHRREIVASYQLALSRLGGVRFLREPDYGTSNFQSFWLEVLPSFALARDELLDRLSRDGISAGGGLTAVHRQPAYRHQDTGAADLSVTERLVDRLVVLPVYHQLTPGEQSRVLRSVRLAAAGIPATVRRGKWNGGFRRADAASA